MYKAFFEPVVGDDGSSSTETKTAGTTCDFDELGLDFSVVERDPTQKGGVRIVDLKPGGRDIAVTEENK